MQTTLSELIERAAAVADVHDNFVTPRQWTLWARQENLALALFIARSGWTQNLKVQTITVAGTEAGVFPLTVTPLAIAAVHQVRSNLLRQVHLANPTDFSRVVPGSAVSTGDPIEFSVNWDQDNDRLTLSFYPEAMTGSVFRVSYVPEPASLVISGPGEDEVTSVSYPMGWEERIALGMARRAVVKEEGDPRAVLGLIQECESRIEEAVSDRVLSESPTIRNVDKNSRYWTSRAIYPSPLAWWWRGGW